MNMFLLISVFVVISLGLFLTLTTNGKMVRITLTGIIKQLYRYWHPNKNAMPTSLEESRTQSDKT